MEKYPVQFIESETGEKIAYRKAGKGKRTLVFVHGNMSSSVYFEELIEKLEDENTIYALDLSGFGDSSYRSKKLSLHDFSLDLTDFIIKNDLRDVYLFGWSMGGGVCMETSVDIPDRIKKLFLLSSVGVKGYPVYKSNFDFLAPMRKTRIYTVKDIMEDAILVKPIMEAIKTSNEAIVKGILRTGVFSRTVPSYELFQKYARATMKQRNLPEVISALANFNMSNEENDIIEGSCRAFKIEAPIYIFHGDRDKVVDLKLAKETKEILGEKAELVVFQGSGHAIMNDNLDELVNNIKKRLE